MVTKFSNQAPSSLWSWILTSALWYLRL